MYNTFIFIYHIGSISNYQVFIYLYHYWVSFYNSQIALILQVIFINSVVFLRSCFYSKVYGTECTFMCWCAIKKLSLTYASWLLYRNIKTGVDAITCFLHACRHQHEYKSRKYLARVIWLLTYDDEKLSLAEAVDKYSVGIQPLHWLPW